MKTARHGETEFLKQCLRYDDTEEGRRLEERIVQLQRDERIVRRAVWLMILLAGLVMAGLGYVGVLMADYPLNVSQLTTQWLVRALCGLGGGSLICLFVFVGLGAHFRKELEQRREDCRRLALKVLESRLRQARDLPANGAERTEVPIVPAFKPGNVNP